VLSQFTIKNQNKQQAETRLPSKS